MKTEVNVTYISKPKGKKKGYNYESYEGNCREIMLIFMKKIEAKNAGDYGELKDIDGNNYEENEGKMLIIMNIRRQRKKKYP